MKALRNVSEVDGLLAVAQLDLGPIMYKLMDPIESKGWDLAKVTSVEKLYRRFLELKVRHPEETIVPTKEIDAMWHAHILDTSKYMVDCEAMFGAYLHHFPYLGMRGEEDRNALIAEFANTKQLYRQRFDEELAGENGDIATSNCNSYCGGNVRALASAPRPTIAQV